MKKILTIGALVSLIPLSSISIVSCKKKKTETNSGDNNTGGDNNTSTPEETPSIPDTPSTPDKVEPNPEETPDSGIDGENGSTSNSGIMTINDYDLGFTASESGKKWFSVRVYGSYLSNNPAHYKFSTKEEKVEIPSDYFSLQMVSSDRTWAYFTQSKATGYEELYKWLTEKYNERKYRSVVVSPANESIKIEVPSKPSETKQPKINKFSLSKTNYGNYVERSIVVNGEYLSSKWHQYELTWKDGNNNTTTIPSHLFRDSQFNDGVNYQVFRLSQTADQKFVEEFDRLLKLNNQGTQVFELKLKENK